MKKYKEKITLNKNNRGCYIIDTVKGCRGGKMHGNKGCYGDCYAKRIADRYGFDFNTTQKRYFDKDTSQLYLFGFEDEKHKNNIINEIKNIDMPFVRIGEMGDPSEDWEHTFKVCNIISKAKKNIVIITKHWEQIPDNFLKDVEKLKLCINTSISALDNEIEIQNRLHEFYRLKKVCNSILRIVSCDFNKDNK